MDDNFTTGPKDDQPWSVKAATDDLSALVREVRDGLDKRLRDMQVDVENLLKGFRSGKRLGLMIRNEAANPVYTTQFMCALFEEEGREVFDVRPAILGHLQQGGDPSPFDRIQATRLASCAASTFMS